MKVVSEIFKDLEFYVINSNEFGEKQSKSDIETLIVAYGGKKVQNFMTTTSHIIAFRNDFKAQHLF